MDLPIPKPGPDNVLARVRTTGVGPWDAKIREGLFGTRSRTVSSWRTLIEDRAILWPYDTTGLDM